MFDHTSGVVFAPFVAHLGIISEACDRLLDHMTDTTPENPNLSRFSETAQAQASIVVVLAAIVLESFIQNYAARRLGETFAKRHIESMSIQTKWLVVPRLAAGRGIAADYRGMELLGKLVSERNRLVHLKGKNMPWKEVQTTLSSQKTSNQKLIEAALCVFECMGLLGTAVCEIDPNERIGRFFAQMTEIPKYRVQRRGADAAKT